MEEFRLGILSSIKKNNMQDQALELMGALSSEPIKIAQLYSAKVEKAQVVKAMDLFQGLQRGSLYSLRMEPCLTGNHLEISLI